MGTTAGRWTVALPWLALVLVTALLLVRLGERREAPPGAASSATPAAVQGGLPEAGPALGAAEEALDRALQDLEAARGRAQALEAEHTRLRERAEAAEARLAAASERLGVIDEALVAAEDETESLRRALLALGGRVETLETRRVAVEDAVQRWLKDAADEDPERQARAWRAVGRAKPTDLEHLAALVTEVPERALPAARLLGHAEPSEPGDRAVVAVLLAPGEDGAERVKALGSAHVVRPGVLAGTLPAAAGATRRALLEALLASAARVPEDARAPLAAALAPLLSAGEPDVVALASRGFGVLRLDGGASALAPHLAHADAAVRAAAAYALSRVPDAASVAAVSRQAVLSLLGDGVREVRLAGVLLAEALLGERVAFDVDAPPEVRTHALQGLGARLP